MLFLVWTGEPHRAAKDLDLPALKSNSVAHLEKVFRAVCKRSVEDDGLIFLADSVAAEPIRENDESGLTERSALEMNEFWHAQ